MTKLGIAIPDSHCFTGFDAYQQLLELDEINYVILATPPHFRPQHLEAAINAGKNVFMEKPCAVDVPGVLTVMKSGDLAREKKLGIAAGTQRRHVKSYRETIERIHQGAIGEIVYGKCYWNGGQIWVVPRKEGWSDMEWQLRNWNYFTWLSGDHIVEQHVHNLDVMNWVLGSHPIRAISGLGGRQVRTGEKHGHIFDHFAVEFEYPNGVSMFSQCRQINDCRNMVEEMVVGMKGQSNCKDRIETNDGERWRFKERSPSGYRLEHEHLIESIRSGSPINEAQSLAEGTLTGIIGREAVYSGQTIDWDDALKSTVRLGPERYEFGPYPMPDVAMPGRYRFS
jgi:predicted dehydrogenase